MPWHLYSLDLAWLLECQQSASSGSLPRLAQMGTIMARVLIDGVRGAGVPQHIDRQRDWNHNTEPRMLMVAALWMLLPVSACNLQWGRVGSSRGREVFAEHRAFPFGKRD